MPTDRETVSHDDEQLILVDPQDRVLGYRSKAEVHEGSGLLHRAFSIFLFDSDGSVLLQQRSAQKRLWPGFWSNSCCSHPRRGETVTDAAKRRAREELGLELEPEFVYRFIYDAAFEDRGSERELCSVFFARSDAPLSINNNEIAAVDWVSPQALTHALDGESDRDYTPWLVMEWQRLTRDHAGALDRYSKSE